MNLTRGKVNIYIGIGIILACMLALFGINRFGENVQAEEKKAQQAQQEKEKNERQAQYQQQLEVLYGEINALIKEKESLKSEAIGIGFYDLSTKRAFSLNGDEEFLAASTSKVMLAMLVADKIQAGELALDQQVLYTVDDYADGTGAIINHRIETNYSIEALLEYMLVYSDNVATNMLYRKLGGRIVIRDEFRKNYLPELNVSKNLLTANQARDLLIQLNENKKKNPLYGQIIQWLKQTEFPIRLSTDRTIEHVAHKIGSVNHSVHDIGLFDIEHPYILTFYSTGLPEAEAEISTLSDKIYQLMTESYPVLDK
ncbi:hypothetical protein BAU15_11330 [Enterococcus sp. JM4C]|uniref:serine hydrolase n=1 Tax=Candidatus Enterococcus huntleyi TaxID=1857217 RepID=UPI00137A2828|nr:serine hydrolase [Enterococcus sp. JM4C]KAF1297334.1 hypothetical protein BAU15_11330 [Enterococcus sp. JM4C]